jgi:hypothetical protein
MAQRRASTKNPRGRMRRIARELVELDQREEELEREFRRSGLTVNDSVFRWFYRSDIAQRSWNTSPTPLRRQTAA